jgi:chromosome segregation ATPase
MTTPTIADLHEQLAQAEQEARRIHNERMSDESALHTVERAHQRSSITDREHERQTAKLHARLAGHVAALARVDQRIAQLRGAIEGYAISEGQARKAVQSLESDLAHAEKRRDEQARLYSAAMVDYDHIADRLAIARTALAQVAPNTIAPPAPAAAPGSVVTIHQRGMPSYTVPATPAPPTTMREVDQQLMTKRALDRLSE